VDVGGGAFPVGGGGFLAAEGGGGFTEFVLGEGGGGLAAASRWRWAWLVRSTPEVHVQADWSIHR
jgi:hypothetical protein